MVAIPADPNDPEDFDVTFADLERARFGKRFRLVRHRLGLTQEQFCATYGIPLTSLRQYEQARYMPPPAIRAYLTVIEAEPDVIARALAG